MNIGIFGWIVLLLIFAILAIPTYQIAQRLGYKRPWFWALVSFFPLGQLGLIIVVWIWAFSEWPRDRVDAIDVSKT